MKIKEVMTRDMETISADASLKEAAQIMKKSNIGFIPVKMDSKIEGVVTDRDLAIRAIAEGLSPDDTKVKEIMSKGLAYCHEDDDFEQAGTIMQEHHLRRLVVLDQNDQPAGIVSLDDLATEGSEEIAGRILHHTVEPYHHRQHKMGPAHHEQHERHHH